MTRAFVNSLPKSGTNLVQKLLELLGMPYSQRSLAFSSSIGRHQLIKQVIRGAGFSSNPVVLGLEIPSAVRGSWLRSYVSGMPDGQYLSGHAAYSDNLRHILDQEQVRVIQVIRDPLDTIYSWIRYFPEPGNAWYPFHRHLKGLDLEERARFLVKGGATDNGRRYCNSFRAMLNGLAGWFHDDSVCVVRFEDLIGPQGGGDADIQLTVIRNICTHLGLEGVDAEHVAANLYGGSHTFRKGKVGAARDALGDDISRVLQDELEGIGFMQRLGYVQ